MTRWEEDLQAKNRELERPVLLEMQARLLRLALNLPAESRPAAKRGRIATITDTGLNKVEQMACFVARNYSERLRPCTFSCRDHDTKTYMTVGGMLRSGESLRADG